MPGTFGRAAADLDALGRRWALVGGFAVSARTEPRFTRDADLAVLVTDDRDAEALVLALQDRGYRVLSAVEQEATGRLATVRLAPQWETGRGLALARDALVLIQGRGFQHGRDLLADLDALIAGR